MSRRKFLHEINKMTHKGVYPSLRILLEEDEENKNDSGDDPMGGDNPFGDDDSDDSGGEGDSGDDAGSSGGEGDSASKESPETDSSGISDAESESIKVDTQVSYLAQNVEILKNKPSIDLFVAEYLPNSSIVDNKIYSLENFLVIKEDTDKLEKTLEDMDDILNKEENKEKILKIKKKANALQTGDPNFQNKIPQLVKQTISNIEHFDSLYDIPSIAASDMLDSIENQSVPKDLNANVEEYIYQLADALEDQSIEHALNVDASVKPSKFKNAKGGFNRS